jgi:hypothetical protein
MQQLYKYKLTNVTLPEDTTINDYGSVYVCDRIDKKKYGLDYRHKEAVGAFCVDKQNSNDNHSYNPTEKITCDIIITSVKDFGPETICYYDGTVSNIAWWSSKHQEGLVIENIIIPYGISEPYSENVLGTLSKECTINQVKGEQSNE